MSPFVVAFFIALGSGVWLYYKFAKRTGSGNLKPAIIASSVVALIVFLIAFLTLSSVLKK